jgi:hypothetical protein
LHLIALVVFGQRNGRRKVMSLRRWVATAAVLCGVAWALREASPGPAEVRIAVLDPQGLVDRAGADALVLSVVPALAWLVWAWGAVGLLLTAASTAPGATGRLAAVLLAGVLPAGARRAAAVALGLGLSTAAPVVLPPGAPPLAVATAAAERGADAPPLLVDWPTAPAGDAVPDWPGPPAATPDWPPAAQDQHVVVRGDCLWDVAAAWLQRRAPGTPVSDAEVQRAVQAWWQANAAVIGPDPDLLLPGQVLSPPG